MKSLLLLVCLLIPEVNAMEIFAASGETIVLPMYTRLEHTSGQICNKYEWIFMGRYEKYKKKLGSVDDLCQRIEWTNKTRPHCSLSRNGSLQLYEVRVHDSGQYTVTTYHLSQVKKTQDVFNLQVLDAVSQPVVRLTCPKDDDQPVFSCLAANGTSILTSITVNGELLREKTGAEGDRDLFKVSSSAPWNVSCSVTNIVSQKTINVQYNMCPVPLSDPCLETFCFPDGSVNISCWTENGSEPLFSWFVDGNPVQSTSSWNVQENLMSGSATIAMNVSCSVRNPVSTVHSPVTTVFCPVDAPHRIFHVFPKILLYVMYNALLVNVIIMIRNNKS
ncbi:uncharacterized protein LOC130348162 [Hyla sarda]|uniref:uncharacterized protein LOC130348162 n=1 Tax=Hyla sarda TaxID=327740 RepID=UPI0024C470C2|nr:uncharacterized protein LOC130348162 [Hyla sarda]